MDAKFGEKRLRLGCPVVTGTDSMAAGNKSKEWNLHDWNWDGDAFKATPLSSVPSDCTSRQKMFQVRPGLPPIPVTKFSKHSSDDWNGSSVRGKKEAEKRRSVVDLEDGGNLGVANELESFELTLGGQPYPISNGDANSWKRPKLAPVAPSLSHLVCQVDDCKGDLNRAKDYHRRHKVCEFHSKSTQAPVGKVTQRFCQQCSRFHVLEEFDEDKRSCRRRLAGHNKRRRKTLSHGLFGGASSTGNYLLLSVLKVLSNMHASTSNDGKHQDMLSHLLKNLASLPGSDNENNMLEYLQSSGGGVNASVLGRNLEKMKDKISGGTEPAMPSAVVSQRDGTDSMLDPSRPIPQQQTAIHSGHSRTSEKILSAIPINKTFPFRGSVHDRGTEPKEADGNIRMNNFDLNCVYDDSQDPGEISRPHVNLDHHKSSSAQRSGNSDSTSSQSTSSSSGEQQSRTDRIVFKLFGKNPNDFPVALRSQILDWLSHCPSDIESFIRPGCIVLTIYLHLEEARWEDLCCNLNTNLRRLIDASNDPFWGTGWIYASVQNSLAFIYNGQIVIHRFSPFRSQRGCRISSIKPVAVCVSETAHFMAKALDLTQSTTSLRLLCSMGGKFLLQKTCNELLEFQNTVSGPDELQQMSFSIALPNIPGRGFIEVEDNALCGSFFPFLVVEKELCSEICTLEKAIEAAEAVCDISRNSKSLEMKNQALEFINEMGWLLHRNQLRHRQGGQLDPNFHLFSLRRFNWLVEFAIDHDWCNVVKKLLCIIFDGSIDVQDYASVELALLDTSLLHKAVSRNCRPMVELLLRFAPTVPDKTVSEKQHQVGNNYRVVFRPDVIGPGGLTPLHVAASKVGSEGVLDALTNDPGRVGIKAWRGASDSAGLTPNDYACQRGFYSYVQLVQRKVGKELESGHVVLNIPRSLLDQRQKPALEYDGGLRLEKLENESNKQCSRCEMRVAGHRRTSLLHRPAMLSMVAIAAVCVCVGLLFKSSPDVVYILRPFRWEQLQFGSS